MNIVSYNDVYNQLPPKVGVPYYKLFRLNSPFAECTFWQTKSDGIKTSFMTFVPFYEHELHVSYIPLVSSQGHVERILMKIETEPDNHENTITPPHPSVLSNTLLQKRLTVQLSQQQRLIDLVSHQLQRPLALIQGYTDLFFETPEETYKKIITKEIHHASFLIEQLLKYSQIEAGKKELSLKRKDLCFFLQELFETFSNTTKHTVTLAFPEHDMVICRFDEFEIGECIKTILDNAFKYVPEDGTIACRVETYAQYVDIIIEDDGPGISDYAQSFLWDPFGGERAEVSTAGFGLGLPLTKKILELHGGKIRCESEVGSGTRFILTLPRIVPAE